MCGYDDYDPADLLEKAEYENIDINDRRVKFLKSVLTKFDTRQRKLFLKFLTGRESLTPNIRIRIIPDDMYEEANEIDISHITNQATEERNKREPKSVKEQENLDELVTSSKIDRKDNKISDENKLQLTAQKQQTDKKEMTKCTQEERVREANNPKSNTKLENNQTALTTEVDRRLPHASTCFY